MDSVDIGIYIAYISLGIALIASIVLPLVNALKHPAALVKSLVGVGGLVVLFIVAYSLSGSEVSAKAVANGIDESSSKMIGAGLLLFYFVFVAAAVGIVFSEISKSLK